MSTLIAFDTATERLVVALGVAGRSWVHEGAGGARASASLLPAVLELVASAGIGLGDLDAIAFGRGPGAFTGLRTACSVAQGLALGLGKPVLPIDSLLVVAAQARASFVASGGRADDAFAVWVAIDARMDEIYAAEYRCVDGHWWTVRAPMLVRCEALNALWAEAPPEDVAGDALQAFAGRLHTGAATLHAEARPGAAALLGLAEAAWRAGAAVDPAEALPLYVRDRVAETTAERDAAKRAGAHAAAAASPAASTAAARLS